MLRESATFGLSFKRRYLIELFNFNQENCYIKTHVRHAVYSSPFLFDKSMYVPFLVISVE